MFVEDDPLILELQSSMLALRFPNFVFHTATNGKLGLEQFRRHEPDIVITDINMTEMCGVQMSETIRSCKPDIKIIAITGKSGKIIHNDPDNNEFVFDHLIVKPVDLSELFAVVERCIGEIQHRQIKCGFRTKSATDSD